MVAKKRKSKVVQPASTPISAAERTKINKRVNSRHKSLRRKYLDVHGRVVDFISHSMEDGTLYFTVRFMDQTSFSLRYRCGMFVVGADLCDVKTGNFERIREI